VTATAFFGIKDASFVTGSSSAVGADYLAE
jgi:hypothetical protein